MLDRDLIPRDDDAFDEQPHEALAADEVQLLQPDAQRRCKSLKVIRKAVEAGLIQFLRGQIVGTGTGGGSGFLEPLATCPELLDAQCPALVGVEQTLELEGRLALHTLQARAVARPVRRPGVTRPPGSNLLLSIGGVRSHDVTAAQTTPSSSSRRTRRAIHRSARPVSTGS